MKKLIFAIALVFSITTVASAQINKKESKKEASKTEMSSKAEMQAHTCTAACMRKAY